MAELTFECIDSHPDRYAAMPTMVFRLRITETSGEVVHAIGLRVQFRIEPHRRRYSEVESVLLADLFGETSRWGDTLKPMQFATIAVMVPGFSGSTEIDVPVPCTYDLEVAAGKYFANLEDGEIPMILLFSGTVFVKGPSGFAVDQVSWASETRHRLPVAAWKELMDRFFPGAGWMLLHRETLQALQSYKVDRSLGTWDEVMITLLRGAAP
jgi:Family of unknown function (DUF6084)